VCCIEKDRKAQLLNNVLALYHLLYGKRLIRHPACPTVQYSSSCPTSMPTHFYHFVSDALAPSKSYRIGLRQRRLCHLQPSRYPFANRGDKSTTPEVSYLGALRRILRKSSLNSTSQVLPNPPAGSDNTKPSCCQVTWLQRRNATLIRNDTWRPGHTPCAKTLWVRCLPVLWRIHVY
jgi:hypothetical protein